MKNKKMTLIPMILITLCFSLSASAAGPTANPANGMMYYNAVAHQQKTNLIGMANVASSPDLLAEYYEQFLSKQRSIQEQLEYLAAKGDNMTDRDKDQIRVLLYQYEQFQKTAADVLKQLNESIQKMAAGVPRSALMAAPQERISPPDLHEIFDHLERATQDVKEKLRLLAERKDSMSIADIFEMQMAMNKLSQLAEMSTSVTKN